MKGLASDSTQSQGVTLLARVIDTRDESKASGTLDSDLPVVSPGCLSSPPSPAFLWASLCEFHPHEGSPGW